MRDFLEDALGHRDDGYGRAQRALQRDLPKRFYKTATIGALEGGYTVLLDSKPTLTPGKVKVRVPRAGMAELMAAEWNAQGKAIDAETMPVVRLVNAALESGEAAVPSLRAEVLKYIGTDLLYYRAETPVELLAEQEKRWDPILGALARQFDVRFETTHGVTPIAQPAATLETLAWALETSGLFAAAALTVITGICGSGLIALALREGLVAPEDAWQAAHVDEYHNMRLWGADSEALKRLDMRRRDFDAGVAVLELAGNG